MRRAWFRVEDVMWSCWQAASERGWWRVANAIASAHDWALCMMVKDYRRYL
jgi:hypothetical protein